MTEEEKPVQSDFAKREEETLTFWRKNVIFEKSLERKAPKGDFIFYDGPPFATGLPHFGHILAGTIKDAIARYKSMQGFRVPRRWGWDCHGLPLENQIEEELNIKTKKDIEVLGIERFNKAARDRVLRYAEDWKRIIPRMGRWVDMEHDYKTMDATYTESVWWAFKTLHDKKLIYEGFKAMQLCPRCGTTLSNFEVSQGYKEVTDIAVTVKFELLDTLESETETTSAKVFLLAWTTTPWTLPGNVALAVAPAANYCVVQIEHERYVLARDRLSTLSGVYTIVTEFLGAELIGKRYRPVFEYYQGEKITNKENAWKVYGAEFVSMEEGTGIVHIAPAFGEDDLMLAQKEKLPIIHHVGMDGAMVPEVREFAGLQAKPKEDPTRTDVEILKLLAQKNLLFKKEKIVHSYAHCWRCETPLLNYAASSWFVEVGKFRDDLVAENEKVLWVPEQIKEGRFGNWLRGARDWSISRSRFWGAPIPVWRNKSGEILVIGSFADLKARTKTSGNRYFLLRHGEAENNTGVLISGRPETVHHLTEEGHKEIGERAEELAKIGIDRIIVSPFLRTKETAAIVVKRLQLPEDRVTTDPRLGEIFLGELDGHSSVDYVAFGSVEEKFTRAPKGGETLQGVKERVGAFLYDIDQRFKGEKILLITHEYPAWLMMAAAEGAGVVKSVEMKGEVADFGPTGTLREFSFTPLPHNEKYELDLHRPYIDDLALVDEKGEPLKRVLDVFDCWFESGSMPFASHHYPFEHTDIFDPQRSLFHRPKGFPADFISESIDQTRGWFYSLLVLSTALFGRTPYRAVITNGMVLAEDGRKMSKRLKNYPDPVELVQRHSADALRYYLLSSQLIRGEDLRFTEKGVDEVTKKFLGRLDNVRAFYALYKTGEVPPEPASQHVLDRWILARLRTLTVEVTEGMEHYELDRATRPLALFIDDLSTWYLRRSRERFKSHDAHEKHLALATTRFVLCELSKLIAPFVPFFAEELFQSVRKTEDPESVHLVLWPASSRNTDTDILETAIMHRIRGIVSSALEARAALGIKVRQPLSHLTLKENRFLVGKKYQLLTGELLQLIKDEVNVKNILFDASLQNELLLATDITPELRDEGVVRELTSFLQDLRKSKGLEPSQSITLTLHTDEYGKALVERFSRTIKETVNVSALVFGEGGEVQMTIDDHMFAAALHLS